MYKSIYVCDHCGKDMGNSPEFTVKFKSNTLAVQEPGEWHYCCKCWGQVRTFLSTKKSELDNLVLEEAVARFKEANKECDTATEWYKLLFALALNESAKQEKKDVTYSSPYICTTVNTIGEKTIQAEPVGNGPFTVGCCCENTNKDSLDYKQTTAPYSSLS